VFLNRYNFDWTVNYHLRYVWAHKRERYTRNAYRSWIA